MCLLFPEKPSGAGVGASAGASIKHAVRREIRDNHAEEMGLRQLRDVNFKIGVKKAQ